MSVSCARQGCSPSGLTEKKKRVASGAVLALGGVDPSQYLEGIDPVSALLR